jgi:phosphoribosylanthranilate isomerase
MNSIEKISPAAIDLNSGVESSPGVKDEDKISEIFKKIRSAKWSDNFFRRNF